MNRILFVDDDAEQRSLIKDILTAIGHKVDTAESGIDALSYIFAYNYDLVITDMVMPVMNGLELCNFIKKKFPQIKVVVLTGYSSLETALSAIESGAENFLVKPIDIHQFESMIFNTIQN